MQNHHLAVKPKILSGLIKTHILNDDDLESTIHVMRNEGCGLFENLN